MISWILSFKFLLFVQQRTILRWIRMSVCFKESLTLKNLQKERKRSSKGFSNLWNIGSMKWSQNRNILKSSKKKYYGQQTTLRLSKKFVEETSMKLPQKLTLETFSPRFWLSKKADLKFQNQLMTQVLLKPLWSGKQNLINTINECQLSLIEFASSPCLRARCLLVETTGTSCQRLNKFWSLTTKKKSQRGLQLLHSPLPLMMFRILN